MLQKYCFTFVGVIALALGTLTAHAQEDRKDVKDVKLDPILERMRKDIFFLASEEFEGRGVETDGRGTLGLDLAAHYIAAQFKKAGLKPGGPDGTFFQPFPYATARSLDGESEITIHGPDGQNVLKQGVDFQVLGTSSAASLTAPVVFVGYGVTARGIEYDDYAGVDVKGKIVIALRRVPRWSNMEKPFDGVNKDDLAAVDVKQARAQSAKAAAVIMVNDASEMKDALMAFATMSGGVTTTSMPFVHMKRNRLEELLRINGKTLDEIEKGIDEDLKPRSVELKKSTITLNIKVKRKEVPVKNVIGYVDGEGPLAKEIVVVGAHYDHVGYGQFGSLSKDGSGKIHYGADDNGSGSTAVMELARRFAGSKNREGRKMVFMTFTAEERGLIGSRHYCKIAPLFPLKDTAAMFNLDMVGRLKEPTEQAKSKLLALGTNSSKGFEDLVKKHNTDFDIVKDSSVFGASDHFSFFQQRIPVLFVWTGTHPEYHRPGDVPEKINLAGMKRITDYAEKVINELRTMEKRPEFVGTTGGGFKPGPKGPRLGINPDYTFNGKGVRADAISEGGPAETAGLKKGDVIIEIAGKATPNVDTYMVVMASQRPGVAIEIKILRDTKEMTLKITPK